jgi:tryptophan synthase alpha chain
MNNRITNTFNALSTAKKAAFIPYIMAGDPDLATTLRLMRSFADLGCDVIELGMPFSDPVADGSIIQGAGLRALKHKISINDIFKLIADFRREYSKIPIVLMGYANPIYRYGCQLFCNNAAIAGADAMIVVDVPLEEQADFTFNSLPLVQLVTPLTANNRLQKIVAVTDKNSMIYLVGRVGITGNALMIDQQLIDLYNAIKKHANIPVIIGFGVKTPADIKKLSAFADGVVVGSAVVDLCHKAPALFTNDNKLHQSVSDFITACVVATQG